MRSFSRFVSFLVYSFLDLPVPLLDTWSPVTIVSLERLLQVLAKRKPQTQTPEEWRCEVEARLKPTQVDLRSYGGGHLPVVRQIQTVISRNGQEVNAIVQVQRDAPAKLLIGTDLLPHLGFLLVQTEVDGEDVKVQLVWGKRRLERLVQSVFCKLLSCQDNILS